MRATLRAICFAAGLALLLHIANIFFVQTDTLAYLSLHELTHRDDVELAFVGSSVARNHFVPDVIRDETGLEPFNLGIPYMGLQGSIASAKLLFEHHQPKWTVLVAEPFLFEAQRESVQTQLRLMPFIRNPLDKAAYYLDTCMEDDQWLDRLMMPRLFGVESLEDLNKSIRMRVDTEYYQRRQRELAEKKSGYSYQGNGFVYPSSASEDAQRWKIAGYHSTMDTIEELPAFYVDHILRFAQLCRKNNSSLIIIYFPYYTATRLAVPNHLAYGDLLKAFCAEQGIPFFNFAMAKEALMPELEPYYENNDHMSIDGANLLSQAFCKAFNAHREGKQTDDYFYEDAQAYLASIDRVVNTWFETAQAPVYAAASNHGSMVTPEYCFAWIDPEGKETIVREYTPDPVWQGEIPQGHTLRVYAKAASGGQTPVYCDLGK